MSNSEKEKSRIPYFSSMEEAAEFWDTHSTTEFEDEWEPVEMQVIEPLRSTWVITMEVDRQVIHRLAAVAARMGMDGTDLARKWVLQELERAEAERREAAPV